MGRYGSTSNIIVRRSRTRIAYYDARLPRELADAFWDSPEALLDTGQPLQLKDVRRTVLLEWRSRRFVAKQYIEPTWRHALKHSFEPSRAWRTWSAAHRLADGGLATPRPVACIESPWGQLRRDSFLMYPYVDGRTLKSYFEAIGDVDGDGVVWTQLEAIWQRLAALRASLSDTNVRNFILAPSGRIWVIDLDKTRFHWSHLRTVHYHRRSWERLTRTAALYASQAAARMGRLDSRPDAVPGTPAQAA